MPARTQQTTSGPPLAGGELPATSRLYGLDSSAIRQVVAAAQELELGHAVEAARFLSPVLAAYPDHPEVLRLHAGILSQRGDHLGAITAMRRAVALRPTDPLYCNTLGSVLDASGDFDGALDALRRACDLQPGMALAWYNLGVTLMRCVRNEEAIAALGHAVELAPDHADARALLADMLRVSGRNEESAAEYRRVLAERPWTGMAWWGLADLRTGALTPDDIERMRSALRDGRAGDNDRIATGFALAKALDEQGRYGESLDELKRANTLARLRQRWNAPAFSAGITDILDAFTPPPPAAPEGHLGNEAIFIVGLPRSGTTLVEQILASHSSVEGAGELPDLSMVLAEESRRRGKPFPRWVGEMRAADWQRLGERYLERTAHWRRRRPRFTDKMPGNWINIGAIRAMLPGARIVVCRRDALETCFSCYRQHLAYNEYTRTFEDLAAYWRDFDRGARYWAGLHASQVYQHDYEALVAEPEHGIRRLLDFCGLPFEEACLRFHETERDVSSPSATQVRQPLRSDTPHAHRYGALLDPLRSALGLPPFGA